MTSPWSSGSRTADYQALSEPLQLYGAIVVQPLSPQQVDSYLTEIGPAGEAVRGAMGHDPMLGEMLDSPLMLNIVTVGYAGQPESQPRLSGTLKEQRDHLFGAYVDQMFRRRGIVRRYTPQQTIHWLQWLAWQMVRHSQTVFYIERLQRDWLPGGKRWAFGLVYRLVVGLVFGLVVGLLVGGLGVGLGVGLVRGLVRGLVEGLVFGLVGGLVFGLVCGLGGGLVGLVVGLVCGLVRWSPEDITCAETVRWSWPKGSKVDLVVGLVIGLVVGLAFRQGFGRVVGLVCGLGGVLGGVLVGGLVRVLVGGRDDGLVGVLVFGLVGGLVAGWSAGWSAG